MSKRLAVLAATTALAAVSVPAVAQDWQADGYAEAAADRALRESAAGVSWNEVETYSEEVVQHLPEGGPGDAWIGEDRVEDVVPEHTYHDSGDLAGLGRHHGERREHGEHGGHGEHRGSYERGPRLAYGPAERAEWLSQCRALRAQAEPAYYYEEDDTDEGLIGGLLGAVVGGVAGNRIADGDRLLGTVIGAGVGGVAGAVIGSIIDGAGDDADERPVYAGDEGYGFDYCEAYLLNWERGYGVTGQVAYAPVAMVPVAQYGVERRSRGHGVRHRVIEEEVYVDEAEHRPTHRRIRRAMPPRHGDKRVLAD